MGSKSLAPSKSILHYTVNTEYRGWAKRVQMPKKYKAKDRAELKVILNALTKKISEQIVERPAGVHIRGLGYFFVWKIPRKMTYTLQTKGKGTQEKYNYHTNQHMYSPIWLQSFDKNNTLKRWSMDNSFNQPILDGISKNIKSGFRYKAYPYSILRNFNKTW